MRSAHPLRSIALRGLASVAAPAPHKAGSVGEILASASAAVPLKDAVKFYGGDSPKIWSYDKLRSNVGAVASGLQKLRYGSGDCIVSWLACGTPEYTSLLLAASEVGATIVSVPPTADASAVAAALRKHNARMLVFDNSATTTATDGKSALDKLKIDTLSCDGGRLLVSADFPALEHVVHSGTGAANVSGALSFRSLLAYSSQARHVGTEEALLVQSDNGSTVTTQQVIQDAAKIGEKLQLSADHLTPNGKLVITPSYDKNMPAGILAALMHESLWIAVVESDTVTKVAENEGAGVFQ